MIAIVVLLGVTDVFHLIFAGIVRVELGDLLEAQRERFKLKFQFLRCTTGTTTCVSNYSSAFLRKISSSPMFTHSPILSFPHSFPPPFTFPLQFRCNKNWPAAGGTIALERDSHFLYSTRHRLACTPMAP